MTEYDFSLELYKLYGTVTRARGCFLYTKKGIRVTDLFQQNGRAILGWEGGNAFTYFKNILSRGLTGSFITEEQQHPSRLTKAVSELTETERVVFAFSNKLDALKAGLSISPQNTSVYKPWNEEPQPLNQTDCLVLLPPLPWTDTVYLLAAKPQAIAEGTKISNCIKLPFALETAVTRAIYNLIAEIPARQEKDWFLYDQVLAKYWTRKGPYLYPKVPAEKYDDFVLHSLKNGIAVNPDCNGTSIVPYKADRGVFTKLKNNPFEY